MSNIKGPEVARARDAAFEELVQRYQSSLLRTCYLCLQDRALAEDAVQETFLRAYRSMAQFRGECGEKTWLMRIAMNICRDLRRSGWMRWMDRRYTPEMLPEPAAPCTQEDSELVQAVMRLPVKLRAVILLHYYQGMNVNEIADSLGIAQSSVSGRLKRGREKLRAALEGREPHA